MPNVRLEPRVMLRLVPPPLRPGWLQGAMTLGGGSAASSLLAGALFGYQLLWVQPLAMLLGIVMLNAEAVSRATDAGPRRNRDQHGGLSTSVPPRHG